MGPTDVQVTVDDLAGMSTTYAVQALQQALASKVCDPDSGDGKTGNKKVRVQKETLKDGTTFYVANSSDLMNVDIGPDTPQVVLAVWFCLHGY